MRLRRHDEAQTRARACPETQVLFAVIHRSILKRACCSDKIAGVAIDMLSHQNSFYRALYAQNFFCSQDGLRLFRRSFRTHPHDSQFLIRAWIADVDQKHEAVELRFWQGVSAFLFQRILRRQNKERLGQIPADATYRDTPLLHRLKHGCLGFGGRPIDLVRQHDVGEKRPRKKLELFLPAGRVLISNVFARPGTPTSKAWLRVKIEIRISSTTAF